MTLHIFNPEHDIALAYNRPHLTVPHAAQELRKDLAWMPAIWASDGDIVLVDDCDRAAAAWKLFRGRKADVIFVAPAQVRRWHRYVDEIRPWGWDRKVRAELAEAGFFPSALPEDEQLDGIRQQSHRLASRDLLHALRQGLEKETCGESQLVDNKRDMMRLLKQWKKIVIKAPWSCSGRGVRYVDGPMSASVEGWMRNTIALQGGIMVEPLYNRQRDFGMEFEAHRDGRVSFEGLSLFQTANGAYTGSLCTTHDEKMALLGQHLDTTLLNITAQRICQLMGDRLKGIYAGPFGIDMMTVGHAGGFLLHPCVEINLRNTMGHAALSQTPAQPGMAQLMRIEYAGGYVLKTGRLRNAAPADTL